MRISRLAPAAAASFIVLWIAATLSVRTPEGGDGAAAAAAYYADSGHRTMAIVGSYLLIVAALAFLCFLVCVRERLIAAVGADTTLSTLAFGAGIVSVALMLAGTFAVVAVPIGTVFGDAALPTDGNITLYLQNLGYATIFVGGMFSAALSIAATSIVIRRTGTLPAWTAWVGFVCAPVLLFAALWMPQVALLIWVLALGIALRKPASISAPEAPSRAPLGREAIEVYHAVPNA